MRVNHACMHDMHIYRYMYVYRERCALIDSNIYMYIYIYIMHGS